jgi:hypothetical protein
MMPLIRIEVTPALSGIFIKRAGPKQLIENTPQSPGVPGEPRWLSSQGRECSYAYLWV